jgi:hypothetical protein
MPYADYDVFKSYLIIRELNESQYILSLGLLLKHENYYRNKYIFGISIIVQKEKYNTSKYIY